MDQFEKFYNKALRFLSYRPRSEKEVRDNLLRHSGKPRRTRRIQNHILKPASQRLASTLARGERVQDDEADSGQARMTVIEQVIAKLKKHTFLNDKEFARWWVEQRTTVRPKSFRVIKRELRHKGISVEIIDSVIPDSSFIIRSELGTVKRLIQKRLLRYRGLERKEQWEKLAGFLRRRGFDYDSIKDALDEVLGKGYNDDKEDREEGS